MERPSRTLAAVRYLMGLKQTPIVRRFAYFGLLLCAADLVEYTKSKNIKIIHNKSCANSPHIVVAMCRILGGPPYSLTLHGDLPVYGTDHVNKMAGAMFVATAGSHLKDQIVQQAGFPAERVLPTWMGLDTDTFSEAGRRLYEPNRLDYSDCRTTASR